MKHCKIEIAATSCPDYTANSLTVGHIYMTIWRVGESCVEMI